MNARPRNSKNRGLPPGLYEQNGYYTWIHPHTRKGFGLGRDKRLAISQAIEANLALAANLPSLVDRITGLADRTLNRYLDTYGDTVRTKYLREGLGDRVLSKIEPLDVAEWLKKWDGKLRMRQAMLSCAKTVFNEAIGRGWLKTNPAKSLKTPTPKTQRKRLSLEKFKAIYAQAEPILQKAINIALVSGQRRGDVLTMKWASVKDGHLHVEQGKTGKKLRIPLNLRLDVLGMSLNDALQACRDSTLSKYVLHHERSAGRAKAGDKWRDKSIEQMFRDARVLAGFTEDNESTFHEIRALAKSLYDAQGNVDTKLLLGHDTEQMAALYKDPRGEWVTIAI